ncbi:hypothetical protein LCGC14_0861890 [marine sediment metagenome]|uniref:Uncharacterized protein n=1 Tax=marine sediment metagenome TaxID=412755 RepID=A0A0F9SE79_9ZZZZ
MLRIFKQTYEHLWENLWVYIIGLVFLTLAIFFILGAIERLG